jgi:hypothetical protein
MKIQRGFKEVRVRVDVDIRVIELRGQDARCMLYI